MLTVAACRMPTKATLLLPSSAEQGRENKTKTLWLEIGTDLDHQQVHLGAIWCSLQQTREKIKAVSHRNGSPHLSQNPSTEIKNCTSLVYYC